VTVHGIDSFAEMMGMIGAIAAFLVFTYALVVHHRPRILPGSSGHRDIDNTEHEEIRADGYIDSFSHAIEEAGGGVPLVVKIAVVIFLVWFVVYLVAFWSPR
jgi:hypothetical protein